jgi:hypothetical protein
MKSVAFITIAILLVMPVSAGVRGQGRGSGGAAAGPSAASTAPLPDPTPFEQFVKKLKLDTKTQLPQVEKIFTDAATEAAPIAQEMIRLRTAMVAQDGKPDALRPLSESYAAAAARMTTIEVRAFKDVQPLLKPDQLSKSAEAFMLMAGLFQPPTPRDPRSMRRGGGGQ